MSEACALSSRERHAEIARAAIDSFERRDVAGLFEFLAPDVECRVSGEMMNAGTWHGHEGFTTMAGGWEDVWKEISYEPTEIEALDDDHVLVHVHQRAIGAHSGVPVELSVVYMVEFRDERAVRLHIYPDRESAAGAIGERRGEGAE
jgi:ketosteroid isomerase-like protein